MQLQLSTLARVCARFCVEFFFHGKPSRPTVRSFMDHVCVRSHHSPVDLIEPGVGSGHVADV